MCAVLYSRSSGDKHRHLQRVVLLQKTMLANILFAAAPIASLVRANQRNGSSSFFHCYVESNPPAGPPTGPSCGLHIYYSPRAPEGGSALKAPPLPERSGQGQAPHHFQGLPSACSLRLDCRPSGAPLTVSGGSV